MIRMTRWFPVLLLVIHFVTSSSVWNCPTFKNDLCACDYPHTLRCTANKSDLYLIASALKLLNLDEMVSLLDYTLSNVTILPGKFLEGVTLHGLVISSGELRNISDAAFIGLGSPLQALGLPNNLLATVPTSALAPLAAQLDRLDLSHNQLQKLDNTSFKGLSSLNFLDLSFNKLMSLSADSLSSLVTLRVLRLQGNRLTVSVVSSLQGLRTLTDMDLSHNLLAGPLGPSTVPRLSSLKVLSLAHNQFSNVTKGALAGLDKLSSLSCHHNQIDVLEDHSFRALGTLSHLDLAHNRIVAVSGASLAHLSNLTTLDMSHNFLRALTQDLVTPLRSLRELRLDDNDISMITQDIIGDNVTITTLTLSDNPLNCDCSLRQFSSWLVNTTRLSHEDKATAQCATPPSLENGLLIEIPLEQMLCGGGDDHDVIPPEGTVATPLPVSGTKVYLRGFQYDGSRVHLQWSVEAQHIAYSCDALFVYEELGMHEVLLESNPLRCNSSQFDDPSLLSLSLSANDLQSGHKYRYCVVLIEGTSILDQSALVLGCSEILALVPTMSSQPLSYVTSLRANVTSLGTVQVYVQLWTNYDPHCLLTITLYVEGDVMAQRNTNCSKPWVSLKQLPWSEKYQVCATLGEFPSDKPLLHCITISNPYPHPPAPPGNTAPALGTPSSSHYSLINLSNVLSLCLILLCVLIVIVICGLVRKICHSPRNSTIHHHACFIPVAQKEDEILGDNRYVKLQATTIL
uniref:Protein slit n=1 Tax=Cacopsylla melanoneura TaxID=428564 RepID=A0A8D8ZE25_9HEMI